MKYQMRSVLLLCITMCLFSCVGKKKFLKLSGDKKMMELTLEETLERLRECEKNNARLQDESEAYKLSSTKDLSSSQTLLSSKDSEIKSLKEQLSTLRNTNANLLDRMSELSIVSKTGAESIQKSLESINQQGKYIQSLTSKIQAKDSTNLVLVMNLKRSLSDINDQDIQIDVRGGVVYVSISDKLLFRSGSSSISTRAETVLGKVAKVVKDHNNLDIMVEGHTDNVPIRNSCVSDNWDLSVKRATAVVRVLQQKHGVDPSRLTAAGRSEFLPKVTNNDYAGRASNRRTEIILTPKLDEYFKLLEAPPLKD